MSYKRKDGSSALDSKDTYNHSHWHHAVSSAAVVVRRRSPSAAFAAVSSDSQQPSQGRKFTEYVVGGPCEGGKTVRQLA